MKNPLTIFKGSSLKEVYFPFRWTKLYLYLLAPILFVGCWTDNNQLSENEKATGMTMPIATIESTKALDDFIVTESSISSFKQVMENIHSLKTLQRVKSKQLILFVPEDAAFEKLEKEEKERLFASTSLIQRHQLFKNSLILHNRSEGDWSGEGLTYGKQPISMNPQTGMVSFKNHQARILKQIHLEGGHLIYVVDTILT